MKMLNLPFMHVYCVTQNNFMASLLKLNMPWSEQLPRNCTNKHSAKCFFSNLDV